jgi:hypothetical protein
VRKQAESTSNLLKATQLEGSKAKIQFSKTKDNSFKDIKKNMEI